MGQNVCVWAKPNLHRWDHASIVFEKMSHDSNMCVVFLVLCHFLIFNSQMLSLLDALFTCSLH